MARYSRSPLAELAQQRLQKIRTATSEVGFESVQDFVTRISPRYSRPEHLLPATQPLDQAIDHGGVFLCASAPPRHAKSETLCFHGIAKYLAKHPDHLVTYCSYSARIAESKSKTIREYAVRAGCELRADTRSAGEWRTREGGGLLARGVQGALTGFGVHLLVVDDPFRDRAEAESPTIRQNVYDWWTSTAITRLEPGGSALITHTRWHPDDLIGRVVENDPATWHYVNLPALSKNDTVPLWPERWSVQQLLARRKQVGEYDWYSMFQGEPKPRGASVFNGTKIFNPETDTMPRIVKIAVGIDLAYTSKTYSDYSVAVVLGKGEDGNFYVLEVLRKQCQAPQFIESLKELLKRHEWPPVFSYIGGVERGVTDFFVKSGIKVRAEVAKADKFVRAQPVAAAWNRGAVILPYGDYAWRGQFVSEVASFTGVGDLHDDQVDALAGAFAQLTIPPPARGVGTNRILPF